MKNDDNSAKWYHAATEDRAPSCVRLFHVEAAAVASVVDEHRMTYLDDRKD
jgi:hypothetical protein